MQSCYRSCPEPQDPAPSTGSPPAPARRRRARRAPLAVDGSCCSPSRWMPGLVAGGGRNAAMAAASLSHPGAFARGFKLGGGGAPRSERAVFAGPGPCSRSAHARSVLRLTAPALRLDSELYDIENGEYVSSPACDHFANAGPTHCKEVETRPHRSHRCTTSVATSPTRNESLLVSLARIHGPKTVIWKTSSGGVPMAFGDTACSSRARRFSRRPHRLGYRGDGRVRVLPAFTHRYEDRAVKVHRLEIMAGTPVVPVCASRRPAAETTFSSELT